MDTSTLDVHDALVCVSFFPANTSPNYAEKDLQPENAEWHVLLSLSEFNEKRIE